MEIDFKNIPKVLLTITEHILLEKSQNIFDYDKK